MRKQLDLGMFDDAYRRYATAPNHRNTNLATFRAIANKYAHTAPTAILQDLVASQPGSEGKWFRTLKIYVSGQSPALRL